MIYSIGNSLLPQRYNSPSQHNGRLGARVCNTCFNIQTLNFADVTDSFRAFLFITHPVYAEHVVIKHFIYGQ
jgi:hypothetical protein